MTPRGQVPGRRLAAVALAVALAGCGLFQDGGPTGALTIKSVPVSDAVVTVNNVRYGPAPVTVQGLEPGFVLVVLEKEGFRRTAKNVVIPDEGGIVEEEITLNPLVGYAAFKSTPPGADIYIDGQDYLGKTPLIGISVPVGEHTYELRLENYRSLKEAITVAPDYQYSFVRILQPMLAELSVFSSPTGAQVWLNEELQPERTPAKYALIPGEYTVSIYLESYITSEENVLLGPNEKRSVETTLLPGYEPRGMVLVPAGPFTMGADQAAPDERPQRVIELKAFFIDKHEVTNEEFEKIFPTHTFEGGQGRYPVAGVSFYRASEYAGAVGKRLPTEEEWEKAARGVDGRMYPWGNDFDKNLCNSEARALGGPQRVGQYRMGASPFGCMDMAGNIYEWTSSWYQRYPGNNDVIKEYGQVFRVLRGGSCGSSAFEVRCVRRHYARMDARRSDYGFRCAKDAQ